MSSRLTRALADADTRWRWFLMLLVAAVLAAATFAFWVGEDGQQRPVARPYADAPYYYGWAPTLFLDHDVDFTNQYRETKNWYRFGPTPRKKPGNVFGAGPGILSAPVFLPAHAVAVAAGERRDGFSTIEQVATLWLSVLLSVLALVFPYRIAARRLDARGAGLAAAVLVFAAGPVVYYAVRQPGYAHPYATFFAAWLVDAWDASFDRPRTARTWALLGAVFGLAVLARPQLATWAVLFAFAAVDDVRRRRPGGGARPVARMAGRWALGAAVALACVAPQFLVWKALYGAYYVVPQGSGFMRWDAPAWSEVLWSSRNGLFPWAPLYAFAALGLLGGMRRSPRLFGALVLAVAAQVVVNGAAWDWWGGGAYGGRRFDSTYVAFALGLAWLLTPAFRAVTQATVTLRSSAPVPARMLAVAGAIAGAAAITAAAALAIANLWMASAYASPSARIHGGEPAPRVIRQKVKNRLGRFAARASAMVTWPVRTRFARRHDLGAWSYDEIVGVHFLGETYPGLNSTTPRTVESRTIGQIPPALRRGFVGVPVPEGAPGAWEMPDGRGVIFVGLNRTGGVAVTLELSPGSVPGDVEVRWNGRVLARQMVDAGRGPIAVAVTTRDLERGVNVLELVGPPGTRAHTMELRAVPLI
jgi:hypothetical protein